MADHATVEMPEKGQNAEMQSHQKSRARIVGGKVPPLDLEWEGLRVDVSVPVKAGKLPCSKVTEATEKTILNNASGIVRSGELVAVMGASGAGKSTLLNVLSGRLTATEGTVKCGGIEIGKRFRKQSAYVQQEDLFYAELTVREHLTYLSRLRLPNLTTAEREQRVEDLISALGLQKVASSAIGGTAQGKARGISGGERKRLAFASEVLTNPSVLFADEPTSGLDSFMAESVVDMMKDLAHGGRTIVATIHQPASDVYAKFDRLLLVCDGVIVYYGDREEAVDYFASLGHQCPTFVNPADYFIRLLSVMPGETDRRDEVVAIKKAWVDRNGKRVERGEFEDRGHVVARQRTHTDQADDDTSKPPATTETAATEVEGVVVSNNSEETEESATANNAEAKTESAAAEAATSDDADSEAKASVQAGRATTEESLAVHDSTHHLSWFAEFCVLFSRGFRSTIRNPILTKARIGQTIFVAIIASLIYLRLDDNQQAVQDRVGAVFFLMINQAFPGFFGVLQTFPLERPIFSRENSSGSYRVSTYFMAKVCVDFPYQILLPVIYTTITFWLIDLGDNFVDYVSFVGVIILVSNAAMSLGYLLSTLVPTVEVALAIGPVVVLPFMLFSGYFLNTDSVPAYFVWLEVLSFFKYGFSALTQIVFDDLTIKCSPGENCRYANGAEVLDSFNISTNDMGRDIGALTGMVVGYRFLAFVALWWKARNAKGKI